MIDTKQKAKDILEKYANSYSQVDLEQLAKHLDSIRAEAIKEFADRLREFKMYVGNSQGVHITDEDIDNIVKAMVGEQNDTE